MGEHERAELPADVQAWWDDEIAGHRAHLARIDEPDSYIRKAARLAGMKIDSYRAHFARFVAMADYLRALESEVAAVRAELANNAGTVEELAIRLTMASERETQLEGALIAFMGDHPIIRADEDGVPIRKECWCRLCKQARAALGGDDDGKSADL